MKESSLTRVEIAILKVSKCIRSSTTPEHIRVCKRLVTLLQANYRIRYLTNRHLMLSIQLKLHEITKE